MIKYKENVVNVLSYYQNADGGLGHAVEEDCWNPASTPLHAGTACEILREIDFTDNNHPLVQGLLNWSLSGEHFNGKSWNITVGSNNDYPHAPWWHANSVSTCHTDYNGTAQIAGFIIRYAEKDSEVFHLGLRIVREAIDALSLSDLNDMHTCACYIQMKDCIEKDVTKWEYYVCKPSVFIKSKDSEYYAENKEAADYQCDFIVKKQLADGSWDVNWNWEGYPDEWAVSKNWWKGQIIIENLLYLKGFGRL